MTFKRRPDEEKNRAMRSLQESVRRIGARDAITYAWPGILEEGLLRLEEIRQEIQETNKLLRIALRSKIQM